jgi:hypothetical protein
MKVIHLVMEKTANDLELIASAGTSEDFSDQVVHLPFV